MNCICYCYFGVDSNVLSLVSCICRHGCDAMVIEYKIESKNGDLDLYVLSDTMSETRVTDMVKREKDRRALKS